MSTDKLAVNGGQPVRETAFPHRRPFGLRDASEVLEALENQNLFFATGEKVYAFENAFSQLYGGRPAVASTSGTSAIHVALGAINPEPGQEVITSPISDMGTVAPIVLQNCIPVFADVQLETFNLDPQSVADRITDRTAAIILVHCWGQPADTDKILEVAAERDIPVIEDCSQVHRTRYKGKLAGTMGRCGTFSLQSSKHLQCGDGGLTIVNDPELAERAHLFTDKGCDWTEDRSYRLRYAFFAPCYRMTELQGAVACAQLENLADIVRRRQRLGDMLVDRLQGIPGVYPPPRPSDREHSYWNFPLRIVEDEAGVDAATFNDALAAEGIPTGGNWIGKTLYEFESMREKITYGSSGYPLNGTADGRPIEYGPGLCPTAERAMHQLQVISFHEDYTEREIEDAAEAVRKVAAAYRSES